MLTKWASGGMADIFVARQRAAAGFDKIVALKVLRDDVHHELEDFEEMFLGELRTAALLSHPSIVQTFDAGMLGDRLYMVMEFVSGETLARFSRVVTRRLGAVPVPLVASIARDVADALHHAHSLTDLQGNHLELVHRDISPSNVLVSFDGRIKLLDFGIAKVARRAQTTRTGVIKGKFTYMSPEQAKGESVDHRTDIYALGVVMWQLLTGKPALQVDDEKSLPEEVVKRRLPPPSEAGADCDEELDRIVMRALAPTPDERYSSADELARTLNDYVGRRAPGYDAAGYMRALMNDYFAGRRARLEEMLRTAEGVDLGLDEEDPWGDDEELPSTAVDKLCLRGDRGLHELPEVDDESRSGARRWRSRLRPAATIPIVGLALAAGLTWWTATPPTRTLAVASDPPGATVEVDGAALGTTPLELDVSAEDPIEVTLRLAGHMPFTRRLAASESPAQIHPTLSPVGGPGTVVVRTVPANALVVVDGETQPGRTPMIVTGLDPSYEHTLIVSLEGHDAAVETVHFGDSRARELELELVPSVSAYLSVSCADTPCTVRVDGVDLGSTPLEAHSISADRQLTVEVSRQGRVVHRELVRVAPGQSRHVRVEEAHAGTERAQPRSRPARQPAPRPAQPPTAAPAEPTDDGPELESNPYLRGQR